MGYHIMSKPSPPTSPWQHCASDDDDASLEASLQQKLQNVMVTSKYKEEKAYYNTPLYKPISRDNQQTPKIFPPSLPTLPNLVTKNPADEQARVSNAQKDGTYASFLCNTNSGFSPYYNHLQQDPSTSPSTPSINQSASSSSNEMNNVSAYFLFQSAARDHFRSLNPHMTQGELSKYTSQQYKSLPPQEKAAWNAQANAARLSEEQGNSGSPSKQPQKSSSKKRKDPNAPKRAIGAYVWFTMDERPKIKKEFKGIKFAEMGKKLGERWRGLGPEEKRKYDMMASRDRVRLQRELKAYTESQSHQQKARKAQAEDHTQQQQLNSQYDPQPFEDANAPEFGYSDEFCSDIIKRLSED